MTSPQRATWRAVGDHQLRGTKTDVPDDRIRVLSALHGIVPLHQVIAPSNLRLGDHGSITPARLATQAHKLWLRGCRDAAPLLGTRGIGDQQRVLAQMAPCCVTPLDGPGPPPQFDRIPPMGTLRPRSRHRRA